LPVSPPEPARVDALQDDPVFYVPFAVFFDARDGRPSIPMDTYPRLMFLKLSFRLGYESRCREMSVPISWQRFRRTPLYAGSRYTLGGGGGRHQICHWRARRLQLVARTDHCFASIPP
jgi:IS5 family transposase